MLGGRFSERCEVTATGDFAIYIAGCTNADGCVPVCINIFGAVERSRFLIHRDGRDFAVVALTITFIVIVSPRAFAYRRVAIVVDIPGAAALW